MKSIYRIPFQYTPSLQGQNSTLNLHQTYHQLLLGSSFEHQSGLLLKVS